MYGFHVNTLSLVQMADVDHAAPETVEVWKVAKEQGEDWLDAAITVRLRENYRVRVHSREDWRHILYIYEVFFLHKT